MNNTKGTLHRLLGFLAPSRTSVIAGLLFSVCGTVSYLLIPVYIGKALDGILPTGDISSPSFDGSVLRLLVSALICALCTGISGCLSAKISADVSRALRGRIEEKLRLMPLFDLTKEPDGRYISLMTTDIDQIADGLLIGFSSFVTGALTIVGTLLFMLSVNLPIGMAVVILSPLSLFLASTLAKKSFRSFFARSHAIADQTALSKELIENMDLISAFGQGQRMRDLYEKQNEEVRKLSLKATFLSSLVNPSTRFINSIVYALVGLIGALFVLRGSFTVGSLTIFLAYAASFAKPFNEISGVIAEMQKALSSAKRLFDLFDRVEEEDDKDSEKAARDADLTGRRGALSFQDVSFGYTPEKKVLRGVSFNFTPGRHYALVGPTGCGKTTLLSLIMRFAEPDSGTILLDDQPLHLLPRETVRRKCGLILQETWLKRATVAENIAYGRPDAGIDEIREAAAFAHADDFIRLLPNGYDTVLGSDGASLSEGQRQLLSIARAFLISPEILLLDEATSQIDTRTELLIQKSLKALLKGRTALIVAHRLSTIREADEILVMNEGVIIERGRHDELIKKDGFYRRLYESQFAPAE